MAFIKPFIQLNYCTIDLQLYSRNTVKKKTSFKLVSLFLFEKAHCDFHFPVFYNSQVNMRAQAPPVIQQSAAQPPPPLAMTQPPQQHTMPKTNKRRTYAIPIIDPATGKGKIFKNKSCFFVNKTYFYVVHI